MPAPQIAFYSGLQDFAFLIIDESGKQYSYSSPYVYTKEIFSYFSSPAKFYAKYIEDFCSKNNIEYKGLVYSQTSFMESETHIERLSTDSFVESFYDLLNHISGYYPIYVSDFCIITSDDYHCSLPSSIVTRGYGNVPDENDFFANLGVYPQLHVSDLSSRMDLDEIILSNLHKDINVPGFKPVLFYGPRFNRLQSFTELNLLMMINILKNPGVYDLYLDQDYKILLQALIQVRDRKFKIESTSPRKLGSLISANGALECLLETDVGTSQIIEVEKNKIQVVPFSEDTKGKISVKGVGLDHFEKRLNGGDLGLIFDTREKKGKLSTDFRVFSDCLKELSEAKIKI